jgi:hypothetical protein
MGTTTSRNAVRTDFEIAYRTFIQIPFLMYETPSRTNRWYEKIDWGWMINVLSVLFGLILVSLGSKVIERYQDLPFEQGGVLARGLSGFAILAGLFMIFQPGLQFTTFLMEGRSYENVLLFSHLAIWAFCFVTGIVALARLKDFPVFNDEPLINSLGSFLLLSFFVNTLFLPVIYDMLYVIGKAKASSIERARMVVPVSL